MNTDKVLAELAEAVERPVEQVQAEINKLVGEGFSEVGAIVRWKADNKFQLGAGRSEHVARLLAFESPRTVVISGEEAEVMNLHFAITDLVSGEIVMRKAAIWGSERIDALYDDLEYGAAYRFKGAIKPDGSLTRVSKLEKLTETDFPEVKDIEPLPIEKLTEVIGTEEFTMGWITRKIVANGETIGFEIADLGVSPPISVWFAGQYSKIPVDRQRVIAEYDVDDKIAVYGYVGQGSNDMRINAINIFKVD